MQSRRTLAFQVSGGFSSPSFQRRPRTRQRLRSGFGIVAERTLGDREPFASRVETAIVGLERRTERAIRGFVAPAVHGQVVSRYIAVAQQRGAQIALASAEQRDPVAVGAVDALEG